VIDPFLFGQWESVRNPGMRTATLSTYQKADNRLIFAVRSL